MSTPREGQRVAYVGDGDHGLQPGDCGKVLSSAGTASHVMWATGARAGEVILLSNMDLVASSAGARTYDDLDGGHLVTIAVRDVYDVRGEVGLLNALNEEGHLATFAPIAEEAISMVAARIRQDPSIQEVLSHLDPDEGAEFVAFAASVLLRDSFGGDE
jgi:hypothetical protein